MSQPVAKRRFRPDIAIAGILLMIPLSISVYCYLPHYEHFTAMGEIVPIREIGVQGSVQFTFVREGVTRNRFERWSVGRQLPDAVFVEAAASDQEAMTEMKDVGEELRNETIRNAVTSVEELSGESVSEQDFTARLSSLIDETSQYYGDSIGLMLGIGLIEETQHEDFSAGGKHVIAGTGTMEADHTVGSVGSIRDKLRTAEKYGAEYFLVPKDKETFQYQGLSNEEEAQQVAAQLGLHLRVVPVANLEEALEILRNLDKGV